MGNASDNPTAGLPTLLVLPAILFVAYGAPLYWPPPATLPAWEAEAGFIARLFPGVPGAWIVLRLLALVAGTALWIALLRPVLPEPPIAPSWRFAHRCWRARAAVGWATLLVVATPWVHSFSLSLQLAFLAALFVPALLLRQPSALQPLRAQAPQVFRLIAPPLIVVAVWATRFLWLDAGGVEAAIAVDQWRAFVAALRFVAEGKNFWTDRYDPEFPGLGGAVFLSQGVPLWALGLIPPSLESMQWAQMATTALAALVLAWLVGARFGGLAAALAVAGFLFSPYMHFATIAPSPFVFAPAVTILLLACWNSFRATGSQAALAAAGPIGGLALTHPSLIPAAGFLGLLFLSRLRGKWSSCRVGIICATAGLLATFFPTVPNVFNVREMMHHLAFHGNAAWLDLTLLGQRTILLMAEGRMEDVRQWPGIVAGAFLSPVAHSRLHIRLWGDGIFDPVTAVLFTCGFATALFAARHSMEAREMLGLFLAALAPAFTSPVERVDIVHAAALPVPVVLLAARGFAAASLRVSPGLRAGVVALACLAGEILVHIVNPRILSASAVSIAFESLRPQDAPRAVLLDYPADFSIDVRWLHVGPLSAHGWREPVGYLRLDGAVVPAEVLVADGKDVTFWSPGLEEDLRLARSLCERWPHLALFRITDRAQLGFVWAAGLGSTRWKPGLERSRWRRVECREILQPHS